MHETRGYGKDGEQTQLKSSEATISALKDQISALQREAADARHQAERASKQLHARDAVFATMQV